MEQSTEKRQELLYKIMIPTIIRKLPFSAKLQENKEDCVSTNLTVAVHNKITSHIITSNKVDKITCKRLNTHVTNFHYMTHPGLEIYYISKKLQHNPLDKKESSLLLLTQYNISYHDIRQKAQGERKKAIASSKKSTTNSKAKIQLNYKFATQKANVKNLLQQQKNLRHQQRLQIRNQREKANVQKGSRFHEFCRRNNIRLEFKEYISDKPIISFQKNKEFIPNQWRIQNINQRFVIKKLLTTSYRKGKYYKLEIEVADRFQHLNSLKQAQYRQLLQDSDPWKQFHTKLTSKHYHILPNIVKTHTKTTNEQYETSKDNHGIVIQGSCFSIEYLQFLTINNKNQAPNIIHLSITLQNITKTFIMVKYNPMNHIIRTTKYDEHKLPNKAKEKNSNDNIELYYLKPLFLKVIRKVIGVDPKQFTFSYNEVISYLTKYIFINKEKFIDKHNISVAYVKNDILGLAFDVNQFHRTQIIPLIRSQLIPINKDIGEKMVPPIIRKTKGDQQLQEYKNPKRFKIYENDTDINSNQKVSALDKRIQALMVQSQSLRILCTD
jgi:hypothetical protein